MAVMYGLLQIAFLGTHGFLSGSEGPGAQAAMLYSMHAEAAMLATWG